MQVTRKAARRSHLGTRTAMSADGACRSRWVAAVGAWHHGRRPGAGRRPPLAPTRRQALVHSNLRRSPRSASPASEQYIATPGKRHKWRRHLRDSASSGTSSAGRPKPGNAAVDAHARTAVCACRAVSAPASCTPTTKRCWRGGMTGEPRRHVRHVPAAAAGAAAAEDTCTHAWAG